MKIEQFNKAMHIRGRIKELKIMRDYMKENYESKIEIYSYRIPKNSKEVILAMCQKEIDELEKEFENL